MIISGKPHSFEALAACFRWIIPEYFNIGVACSDAIAARMPNAIALVDVSSDDRVRRLTFADLAAWSDRFANVLLHKGISRGDRVAIMAAQSIETAVSHLAIYKLGAIAVPMASQFGDMAIAHRLVVSGAKLIVTTIEGRPRFDAAMAHTQRELPIILTDGAAENSFDTLCRAASSQFEPVRTRADDPSMMLFTSGTTGAPKAALHAHRVLCGHFPGIQLSQDLLAQPGDIMWTPSDWAWAGGLLNALLPALALGVPVVAARTARFSPEWARKIVADHSVRNIFMPATALRLMLAEGGQMPASVRAIGTAGEPLGAQTRRHANDLWRLPINEFYGQTECNTVIGSCALLDVNRDGSMGKQTPGHRVALLGSDNQPVPVGQTGQIAVHRSDPAMFLGYWNDQRATADKFAGDWMLTGDEALCDPDGYFHFSGRSDDMITSSGYRIGPSEIEDVLTSHPDILLAAVVGLPDRTRTEAVTAFVKCRSPVNEGNALRAQLTAMVRARLSPHQTPREIHFVDDIPTTESGKIIRRHFKALDASPTQ